VTHAGPCGAAAGGLPPNIDARECGYDTGTSAGHKVAILLPNEWRGGMLRNASALAALLSRTNWPCIGRLKVVVGLLKNGDYNWNEVGQQFAALDGSVSVRRMGWEAWPVTAIRTMFRTLPAFPAAITHCSVPRDYGHNFLDCDAWIIFGSSHEGFVVPARPTAIYCADMIQRYVPQIFGATGHEEHWRRQIATHLGWRRANCVFCTTPQTRTDAISYAGVRASRVLLAPTLVDPIAGSLRLLQTDKHDPYILWITNASAHKNHQSAMEALRLYYRELGGTLPVIVAGSETMLLAPGSGAQLQSSRSVREATDVLPHLRFVGEVTDATYLRLVSEAAVVWHNVVIDNGTFVAFDAARAGRHFVSSDYPQMRYLCERYGVAARWHKAGEPAAAAAALFAAERAAADGQDPGHDLHRDSDNERCAAYGAVLLRLFGNDGA
jgi:hypothetical protein